MYYEELASYDRNGFLVIVDKRWDDIDPRGCFDTEDADEIVAKINDETYDWFLLRVRVMFRGLELGSHYLGGCLYEDAREVLTDGTAEDCIGEALREARREALELKMELVELDLERYVEAE